MCLHFGTSINVGNYIVPTIFRNYFLLPSLPHHIHGSQLSAFRILKMHVPNNLFSKSWRQPPKIKCLDPFPDPASHFGNPWRPFILRLSLIIRLDYSCNIYSFWCLPLPSLKGASSIRIILAWTLHILVLILAKKKLFFSQLNILAPRS